MKCKVCGKEFEPLKENKKVVSSWNIVLMADMLYESFDCPYCGCQNIVNQYREEFNRNEMGNCL